MTQEEARKEFHQKIKNRIVELEAKSEKLIGKGFAFTENIATIVGLQAYLKKFA